MKNKLLRILPIALLGSSVALAVPLALTSCGDNKKGQDYSKLKTGDSYDVKSAADGENLSKRVEKAFALNGRPVSYDTNSLNRIWLSDSFSKPDWATPSYLVYWEIAGMIASDASSNSFHQFDTSLCTSIPDFNEQFKVTISGNDSYVTVDNSKIKTNAFPPSTSNSWKIYYEDNSSKNKIDFNIATNGGSQTEKFSNQSVYYQNASKSKYSDLEVGSGYTVTSVKDGQDLMEVVIGKFDDAPTGSKNISNVNDMWKNETGIFTASYLIYWEVAGAIAQLALDDEQFCDFTECNITTFDYSITINGATPSFVAHFNDTNIKSTYFPGSNVHDVTHNYDVFYTATTGAGADTAKFKLALQGGAQQDSTAFYYHATQFTA